ncbi:MAG TPA: class I SAM-dependent methyltransferase [Edaphocola sp.]|nr:class I SAM-dependent methyltransferase [Edaphocola sp.]
MSNSMDLIKKGFYFLNKGLYYLKNKPIYQEEESLFWLSATVPGWLEKGHLYCFEYAIRNLPDKSPVVELGTFAGLSANTILYFLKKHNKSNLLITSDWYLRNIDDSVTIAHLRKPSDIQQFVKDAFVRNVRFFNEDAHIKSSELPTDEFFDAWFNQKEINNLFGGTFTPSGNISFAYIDGNHVYEYAKRDFENVDKLLVKGGFILFDDSADYTNRGSKLVAQESVKTGRYKIIKKNPHYFIQKIV